MMIESTGTLYTSAILLDKGAGPIRTRTRGHHSITSAPCCQKRVGLRFGHALLAYQLDDKLHGDELRDRLSR